MNDLNDEQRDFAHNYSSGLIVNASPGTGKTTTLVARAQFKLGSIPKYKKIALITYTNAGADEISARVGDKNNVYIGTIHRFCLDFILRPYSWLYGWGRSKVVNYDEQLAFLEANKDLDLGPSPLDEINRIKKNLDGSYNYNIEWGFSVPIEEVVSRYDNYLQSIKSIGFDEILYRSYKIILENDFVSRSLSNLLYELLVDEFQDTTLFQYEIFKKINSSGNCSFFIVGDEKQKILRFAGAIDKAFENSIHDFNIPIRFLLKTYRSTPNIVNAYTSLFEDHPQLQNESPYSESDIKLGKSEFNYQPNNSLEKNIKQAIDDLVTNKNIKIENIAVLSKTWFDSINVSSYLRQEYNIVGIGALPHPTSHIKGSTFDLLKALTKFKIQASIKNLKSLKRNFNQHLTEKNLAIDENELPKIINNLIKSFSMIDINTPLKNGLLLFEELFNTTFLSKHPIFSVINDLINEDEISRWTLEKYYKTLSGVDGILSTTIHQSKGLEFDAVILNQMNVGKVPHQNWDSANRVHEELTQESFDDGKNIFYVALSRAKLHLIVLHNWKPSIFVQDLNRKGFFS